MKAVVVIAFYVWLALTVAIVLGRLARWSASRQATKRRRKARLAARELESPQPITTSEPADRATIDLNVPAASDEPALTGPPLMNTRLAEPVTTDPVHAEPVHADVGRSEPTEATAEERRSTERRDGERRVADRRHAERRIPEPSLPSATSGPGQAPTSPQPATPPPATPPPAPATTPAPEPLGLPQPADASAAAPEPVVVGPTLPQLLAGIVIPIDLVPIVPDGAMASDQSATLISRQRPAHEVGAGIADELERLGYDLTPVGEAALFACRGTDQLTVEIDPSPNQPDDLGRIRFPTAGPTDVVVEFWVGSGARPA